MQTCGHSLGRERMELIRESNISIYVLCVKWIAGEMLLYITQGAHSGTL